MTNQKNLFQYIDLFAGCGGLSDGFEQTQNYSGVAHIEWEKPAAETLRKRLKTKWNVKDADNRVMVFDIQRTEELFSGWKDPRFGQHHGLNSLIDPDRGVDVIIGGPPCQAYSLAGRIRDKNGMRDDFRNYLFERYLEIVARLQPDIFVFENVVGILSAKPGGTLIVDRIKKSFSDAGYVTLDDFRDARFDLEHFGIPQKRSRVIIIGLRKEAFKSNNLHFVLKNFYQEFSNEHRILKIKSAKEAMKGLTKFHPKPTVDLLGKKFSHEPSASKFLNHSPRYHNPRDIEIFKLLAEDIATGNMKYQSATALKRLYTEQTGKESSVHKYFVIRPNAPSNTIPAHLYKDGLRHIHWDFNQARSITVREAARLQTFDDDFEFLGSMGDQYKMIGNAVPPNFARSLALSLINLLNLRR